jgi:protein-S-isoprenylcysteine O-methyltransferase Ste14
MPLVEIMTPPVARLTFLVGIVGWYVIRYPFARRAKRLGVARSVGGTRDRVLLLIAALGQFLIPAVYGLTGFPASADYPFSAAQAWLGVAVLIAALVLFRVTHKQLGRNWSISLELREKQTLVTDGLYAWVRHPMYSSFILFAVAQALLLQNWIAGPVGLVAIAILFFLRVPREEQMMIETFGDAYRNYMRRTARVVPWVY